MARTATHSTSGPSSSWTAPPGSLRPSVITITHHTRTIHEVFVADLRRLAAQRNHALPRIIEMRANIVRTASTHSSVQRASSSKFTFLLDNFVNLLLWAEVIAKPDVHLAGVDLHDARTSLLVGVRELNLPVQTTCHPCHIHINSHRTHQSGAGPGQGCRCGWWRQSL